MKSIETPQFKLLLCSYFGYYFTNKVLIVLSFTFCLMVFGKLKAQDYHTFPDSNAVWSEVFTSEQPFEIDTYQYGISGDTMINSKWYKKIYLLNDTTYPLNTGQFCGGIREDDQKRIFAIDCSCTYPGAGENEVLLYDFSKSIGDTVFVGEDGLGPWGSMVIDHIDSALINGEYRKTFHFAGYPYFWIEGIGSTRGLFSPITSQPTGYQEWELICYNKSDEVLYLNPEFDSCFPLLTGIETQNKISEGMNVFPCPAGDYFEIELIQGNASQEYEVRLFDLTGHVVLKTQITGENNRIDVSGLKAGYFFVRIQSPTGWKSTKVLVR